MTSQLDISNLYTRTKMKRTVTIPASELTTNFDDNLLIKLRNDVEGKCNREGYIEKGSVEIIDHGTLDTEVIRYKGDVRVKVIFTGKVVNPVFGEIIECKVKRFNDFGLMAYAGPLNIVIPFGDKKNKSGNLNVGQKLKVKVVESTIILNDNQIDVYATFYDEKEDAKTNVGKAIPMEELLGDPSDDDIEDDIAEDIGEGGEELSENDVEEESEDEMDDPDDEKENDIDQDNFEGESTDENEESEEDDEEESGDDEKE